MLNYRVGLIKDWEKEKDEGGGQIITEMHGYMPVQRRIEQIMEAGQRLVEHRTAEAYYNFRTGEPIDMSYDDPTLRKGYDPADATQDRYINEARLKASKKQAEALRASQNQKPESGPVEAAKA